MKPNVKYSSRTADKFVLRLPDGMRAKITDLSNESFQSMNSWMVSKLSLHLSEDVAELTTWTPVYGMLVVGKVNGAPILGAITNFSIEEDGDVCIEITHGDKVKTTVPVGDVRPFKVTMKGSSSND